MAQAPVQLMSLRQRFAALTRGNNPNQPRDALGRFGSTSGAVPPKAPEIPEKDLTPAQRALAQSAVNPHGATSQCSYCSKMLKSPLSGQRLGFRFHLTGVHLNDTFCPDCMRRSTYPYFRNKGLSASEAMRRATAMTAHAFTASEIQQWSDQPDVYAGQPTASEENRMTALDAIRLHLATLTRGEYEYTTSNGTEHLVTTGAHGQWVDNQVVGHVGGTSAKSASPGKSKGEGIHEKSARLQHEAANTGHPLPAEVKPTGNDANLHPVTTIEGLRIDPYAKLDANFIKKIYGEHQLGAALSGYSREKLKEAADSVGVKAGKTNEETISRITSKITEGRYSANFAVPKATPASADSRSAAYLRDMAALKATHAAYLADHPEVAKAHDAATTKASKGGTAKGTASKSKNASDVIAGNNLVPVRTGINYEFDPFAAPSPQYLRTLYGDAQLPKALARYSVQRLGDTFRDHLKQPMPPKQSRETVAAYKSRLIATISDWAKSQPLLGGAPIESPSDSQRAIVPNLQRLRSRFAALSAA